MRIKDRYIKLILTLTLILPVFVNSKIDIVSAGDVAPATTKIKFYPSLSNAIPTMGANIAFDSNYQGQGSYIVIIDTGIEAVHSFVGGRVALQACFSVKCPNGQTSMVGPGAAVPVHWHGTHVAGIAGGYLNATMHGVAPKVGIIVVNVFGYDGSASDSDIVRALQWVDSISGQYNIAAVNMSLGSSGIFRTSCNSYLPELTSIIATLKSKNIATVVSAGNDGQQGMNSPACITDTVSVAATYTNSSGQEKITDFSNVLDITDLSAPGLNINSSKLMGAYGAASGTSMSAPMVTGAFAVYRSKYGVQPVDKVVSDFQNTGVNVADDYTKIVTKRIDFRTLFANGSTLPPTTTIPSPTTTLPNSPTTTTVPSPTTTVLEDDDQPENFLNIPYISQIKKYSSRVNYIYLDFTYRYTDIRVSNYILTCRYTNGTTIDKVIPNRNMMHSVYVIPMNTTSIRSCRMLAVSAVDGSKGQYTPYVKVK